MYNIIESPIDKNGSRLRFCCGMGTAETYSIVIEGNDGKVRHPTSD